MQPLHLQRKRHYHFPHSHSSSILASHTGLTKGLFNKTFRCRRLATASVVHVCVLGLRCDSNTPIISCADASLLRPQYLFVSTETRSVGSGCAGTRRHARKAAKLITFSRARKGPFRLPVYYTQQRLRCCCKDR